MAIEEESALQMRARILYYYSVIRLKILMTLEAIL